jgi:hypothetical protein
VTERRQEGREEKQTNKSAHSICGFCLRKYFAGTPAYRCLGSMDDSAVGEVA